MKINEFIFSHALIISSIASLRVRVVWRHFPNCQVSHRKSIYIPIYTINLFKETEFLSLSLYRYSSVDKTNYVYFSTLLSQNFQYTERKELRIYIPKAAMCNGELGKYKKNEPIFYMCGGEVQDKRLQQINVADLLRKQVGLHVESKMVWLL